MQSAPSKKSKAFHYLAILAILSIFAFSIHVVQKELSSIQLKDIIVVVHSLSGFNILLAIFCSFLSYFFLTQYDRLALNYLKKEIPYIRVSAISFMAVAVGHNVGLATLSGGSIRYRAYTLLGLSATEIASLIAFCSITFFLGGSFLLGVVLLTEPSTSLNTFSVSTGYLRLVGCLLLLIPIGYLLLTRWVKNSFSFRIVELATPNFTIGFQQVFFSSMDLIASAGVLYFLLPPGVEISYLVFIGIYLLAIVSGIISNVPGGVGVFEGAMLLMLPNLPKVELMGAILAYRVVYYLIPLALAILLLAIQESKIHGQRIILSAKKTGGWISGVAPQIIGILVLVEGIILLVSGALPGETSRLHTITDFVPLSFLETSHFLNSAIGVGLLVVARGLYHRLKGAYHLSLILLLAGILTSFGKGLDFEEAIALVIAAILLWSCRDEFYRPAAFIDQRFSLGWFLMILSVLASTLWIGLFAYKHVEYSDTLWWKFAVDANAPRMLRGIIAGALAVATFSLWRLTRAAPPMPQDMTDEDVLKAKQIISHSSSASANAVLLRDKRLLFHPSGDTFLMYQISGNSWIALGDPIGNPDNFEEIIWQFKELAHRQGDRCAFYQVGDKYLSLYVDLGLSLSKLGEEAKVPLAEFSLEGSCRADLRHARNKGIRNGACFEILPATSVPDVLTVLSGISNEWLDEKKANEKGFSLGTFTPHYVKHFDFAVVKVEGEIVAFANIWSTALRTELSIDLMRYSKNAPKGVMDFLFVELMLWGKEQGYEYFSLGMAPLSGLEKHPLATVWHKVGNSVFRLGDNFYNFEGLRAYKQKFSPEWKSLYLAAPGGLALAKVLLDATILISGGLRKVFRK